MVGTSNESDPEMALDLFGGFLRERSIETHGALKIFKTPPLWFPHFRENRKLPASLVELWLESLHPKVAFCSSKKSWCLWIIHQKYDWLNCNNSQTWKVRPIWDDGWSSYPLLSTIYRPSPMVPMMAESWDHPADSWTFDWKQHRKIQLWIQPQIQAKQFWWLSLPIWKMMEFVSWDDYSIPNWMESQKNPWFQTTKQ